MIDFEGTEDVELLFLELKLDKTFIVRPSDC